MDEYLLIPFGAEDGIRTGASGRNLWTPESIHWFNYAAKAWSSISTKFIKLSNIIIRLRLQVVEISEYYSSIHA